MNFSLLRGRAAT